MGVGLAGELGCAERFDRVRAVEPDPHFKRRGRMALGPDAVWNLDAAVVLPGATAAVPLD